MERSYVTSVVQMSENEDVRLKLAKAEGRKNVREVFDVSKLQSEEIRRRYNIEVKNRCEALGDIDDPEEEHDMILAT